MASLPEQSKWLLVAAALVLVFSGVVFFLATMSKDTTSQTSASQSSAAVSEKEKQAIDNWIAENELNDYGDPRDTVYGGGTPLFNEVTGERVDRYSYIVKQHPDKPWNK